MTDGFLLENGILTISAETPYIKSQQFVSRDDIVKVIVSSGVGFFEEEAFAECVNLEEVILPEGLVNIGIASFTGCEKLSGINIPSTVREIEEGAFLSCPSLVSIELPEGLERIADLAFQSTGLEKVTIPESVRYIGEEAFFECENLTEANVLSSDTVIAINAFGSCYNLVRGYIAPGFPEEDTQVSEFLYSVLWATSQEKHADSTSERAISFIRKNESLVMDRIMKTVNVAALNGIVARNVLDGNNIDKYVTLSADLGLTEITALLLKAKGQSKDTQGEFEL